MNEGINTYLSKVGLVQILGLRISDFLFGPRMSTADF